MMAKRTIFTPQRYVSKLERNIEKYTVFNETLPQEWHGDKSNACLDRHRIFVAKEPGRKHINIVHTCIEKSMDPPGLIVKEINDYIGKGVFAEKKFPMGSFLMEYHGELISKKEGIKRERAYPKEYGSFLLFFKCGRTEMCVDATFSTQLGRFVNDSVGCKRNADLKIVFVNGKPHVGLFASRNICKGEEIRYDYGVLNLPWRHRHKKSTPQVLLKRLDPGANTHTYRKDDGTFADLIIIRHLKTQELLLSESIEKGNKQYFKTCNRCQEEQTFQHSLTEEVSDSCSGEEICHPCPAEGTSYSSNEENTDQPCLSDESPVYCHEEQTVKLCHAKEIPLSNHEAHPYLAEETSETCHEKQTFYPYLEEETSDTCLEEQTCHPYLDEETLETCHEEQTCHPYLDEETSETCHEEQTCHPYLDEVTSETCHEEQTCHPYLDEESFKTCYDQQMCRPYLDEETPETCHEEQTCHPYTDEETSETCHEEQTCHPYLDEVTSETCHEEQTSHPCLDEVTFETCHEEQTCHPYLDEVTSETCHAEQTGHPYLDEVKSETCHEEQASHPYLDEETPDTCNNEQTCHKEQTCHEEQTCHPYLEEETPETCHEEQTCHPYLDEETPETCHEKQTCHPYLDEETPETCHEKQTCHPHLNEETPETCHEEQTCHPYLDEESFETCYDQQTCHPILDEETPETCHEEQTCHPYLDEVTSETCHEEQTCHPYLDEETSETCHEDQTCHPYLDEETPETCHEEQTCHPYLNEETSETCHEKQTCESCLGKKGKESAQAEERNECFRTETEKTDAYLNPENEDLELVRETMPEENGIVVLRVCKKKKKERKEKKRAKPYRPCPFCFEFKAKLLIHFKSKHKNEKEVKHALSLPPNQQKNAFAELRKLGIYKENIKRIREKGTSDNVELIRERKQGNGNLITCMACKGFFSRSQFYRHRKICSSAPFLDPPTSMEPIFLANIKKNKCYESYQIEVLGRFRRDDVGDLCRTDPYITAYGYHKFLSIGMKKRKKDEKRKSLMTSMRTISKIYIDFKAVRKGETTSSLDMFLRANKQDFKETIYTRKSSSSAESNLLDGNTVKRFVKFLRDMLSDDGDDDHHAEMNKFLHTLSYHWRELFGDSERETRIRRSEKRKPVHLPVESDLITLRKYTLEQLKRITSDAYNFIAEAEFTFLRDLLVSRLTLYNARRGGEPSRLILEEWRDAEKGTWLEFGKTRQLENPENVHLLKQLKVAYQTGKNDGTLVPVVFPSDCLAGLKLLSDPVIRKDAGVSPGNVYLFPRTQSSEFHVIGTTCIDTICKRAGVKSVTATKVRHRTSTLHAQEHRTEDELKAFYSHMGHSDSINRDVYQCPPAIAEITKVGRFLESLDTALQIEEESVGVCQNSNSSPSLKAFQLEDNLTGVCEDSNSSPPLTEIASQPERTSAGVFAGSSSSSGIESEQGHSSTSECSRISLSLKGFLYTVADIQAVRRVLKNHNEPIEEQEVETKPEEVFQVSYDHHVLNAAKLYFTADGWLAVKHLLDHAKALNRASVNLQNTQGLSSTQTVERVDTPDSTFFEENVSVGKDNAKQVFDAHCGHQDMSVFGERIQYKDMNVDHSLTPGVNTQGKRVERLYTRWRKEDTEKLNKHFAKYVYDVTRFDNKGILPGYTEIRQFLKKYPDFIGHLSLEQQLKTIHIKLYNERNKSRRIAKAKFQY